MMTSNTASSSSSPAISQIYSKPSSFIEEALEVLRLLGGPSVLLLLIKVFGGFKLSLILFFYGRYKDLTNVSTDLASDY